MAFAYCNRAGVIEIGSFTPKGALPLGKGKANTLTNIIQSIARLSKDNKTWLVPGVPEAETDEEALEAAIRFHARVKDRLPGGMFHDAKGGA